jgi:hypothetical protein
VRILPSFGFFNLSTLTKLWNGSKVSTANKSKAIIEFAARSLDVTPSSPAIRTAC